MQLSKQTNMADLGEILSMVKSFHVPELLIVLRLLGQETFGRKGELMTRALLRLRCIGPLPHNLREEITRLYRRKVQQSTFGQNMNAQRPPVPPGRPGAVLSNQVISPLSTDHALNSRQVAVSNVKLRSSPFYEKLSDVMRPTLLGGGPLSGSSNAGRQQTTNLTFGLNQDQISVLPEFYNKSRCAVHLCFFNPDDAQEQVIFVPLSVIIRVNCHSVPLPRLCACIVLVRCLTAVNLLNKLTQNGVRDARHTRSLIKEKLLMEADSDITTTSLRLSLLCPLGKIRMSVPCHSYTCTHLQCFDALTYLQMNEKKQAWICPICDQPAEYRMLFIDGLFTEIINNCKVNDIHLSHNGDWSPAGRTDKTGVTNHESKKSGLTDSSQKTRKATADSTKRLMFDADSTTIDLTETDDESDLNNSSNSLHRPKRPVNNNVATKANSNGACIINGSKSRSNGVTGDISSSRSNGVTVDISSSHTNARKRLCAISSTHPSIVYHRPSALDNVPAFTATVSSTTSGRYGGSHRSQYVLTTTTEVIDLESSR